MCKCKFGKRICRATAVVVVGVIIYLVSERVSGVKTVEPFTGQVMSVVGDTGFQEIT